MRGLLTIFFLAILTQVSLAQAFRTVVPKEAVVIGDAFQVQYIVEDHSAETLKPPSFTNFRLVSGPAFYTGKTEDDKPVVNAVFTLEPLRPGKFIIQGATLVVGARKIKSNNAEVLVLSVAQAAEKKEAANDYFLRPGEDPFRKIRENIFIRVQVNKRNVYVGEPVQAVFKLYSRLQSRSDILKNPGFYGFSVFDQVNLADKESTVENIGGKLFDVHTVRKVQLFPLQAGHLYIDEMEVRNRVEFSRSAVNKKTEQEIAEGMSVFDEDNEKLTSGSEIFESQMHTEPVVVTVKPLPSGGKPESYQGAVGEFFIETSVDQSSLATERKGVFILKITGSGNFMQIDAPRLSWPAGIEVFEPRVRDEFDRSSFPLKGERVFRYPFVLSKAGVFSIPGFSFQFFNPNSGKYRRSVAKAISVSLKEIVAIPVPATIKPAKNKVFFIWVPGVFLLACAIFFIYRSRMKRREETESIKPDLYSLENLWKEAKITSDLPPGEFYANLVQFTWKYFENRLSLRQGEMNKAVLLSALCNREIDEELIRRVNEMFTRAEAVLFTSANFGMDLEEVLTESLDLFRVLDPLL